MEHQEHDDERHQCHRDVDSNGAIARAPKKVEVGLDSHGEKEEDDGDEGEALMDVGPTVGEKDAADALTATEHGGREEDADEHVNDKT